MPCPHNEISIVQRSQQQSAVAAAAYQSGEKLFCEYDQQVKHYPEKRGIQTNIGNLNREIRAANRLMKSIRQLIQNLKGWITELGEKRKELLAQKAAEEATLLPNLLKRHFFPIC